VVGIAGDTLAAVNAPTRPDWSRQLSLIWALAGVVLLILALIARDWFFALLAALIVVGSVLHLRRTRPAAARERAEQDTRAASAWPPARVRAVAGERGLDLAEDRDRVTVIAAIRREEPRLSLLTAKRLVDEAR
jgi:hypothetical protein